MNLQQLLEKGTVSEPKMVKKTVTWERQDPNGNELVSDTFDIFIVCNLSFAASDRILIGDGRYPDASQMARAISERVRFGEKGDERMSYNDAARLDPGLGWVLVNAINDVQAEQREAAVKH